MSLFLCEKLFQHSLWHYLEKQKAEVSFAKKCSLGKIYQGEEAIYGDCVHSEVSNLPHTTGKLFHSLNLLSFSIVTSEVL